VQGSASVSGTKSRRPGITLTTGGVSPEPLSRDEVVWSPADALASLRAARGVTQVARYAYGRLATADLEVPRGGFVGGLLLRVLARGPVWLEDGAGRMRPVTPAFLGRALLGFTRDAWRRAWLLEAVDRAIDELETEHRARRALDLSAPPLYLYADLARELPAGGAVTHVLGVVNELARELGGVRLLSTVRFPLLDPEVELHGLSPDDRFWDFPQLPRFYFNRALHRRASQMLQGAPVSFIYERYCVDMFAGARLAQERGLPRVLEYNGSEIWIHEHWGMPLRYAERTRRIEAMNVLTADLVVVVSEPLRQELLRAGVEDRRILVNPNGVDEQRYRPDLDGDPVRRRLGFGQDLVFGFIGTFGPWHGADVAAAAFVDLLQRRPDLRERARLMLIGDGPAMPEVRRIVAEGGVEDRVVLTGTVPQPQGPSHLAACDILLSPHVPNPDGSPFFGSPTKLFEYLAMGRPIVASDLDQIGEVLEDGVTALMVRPGDAAALSGAMERLAEDGDLRGRLGSAARARALERHTWKRHTRRILDRLQAVTGGDA
jgi:glycosyltransferase involved in cell wall biosynthesis